jgi:hypothetical protein
MQQFRSKAIVWLTSVMIFIGVGSRLVSAPEETRKADTLTSWLLTFADVHQSDAALSKLSEIDALQSGGFLSALTKASEIIVAHPDLFSFPVDANSSSNEDVLEVLLLQWDLHNQASGMSKGLQPDRSRATATTPQDIQTRFWSATTFESVQKNIPIYIPAGITLADVLSFLIRPFTSGLAINAP